MAQPSYHYQLNDLITHGLLHLYSHVAPSKRYVPLEQRNMLIHKWLKKRVKHPKYKSLKSDIKSLIWVTKQRNGNVEAKLHELNIISCDYAKKSSDARKLFELFNHFFDDYGIESSVIDDNLDKVTPGTIYVSPDHIERCFDDSGTLIAPLSVFVKEGDTRHSEIVEIIGKTGLFSAEIKEVNNSYNQCHIVLQPI